MDTQAVTVTLSSPLPEEPATEICLFRPGVNRTTKGDFLFDEAAAAAVMAAFQAQANDLMIDLGHLSLRDPAEMSRDDAEDARGWFQLEVRNGELWATNVRWTSDGERRVREKRQRYVSPAFRTDDENRVIEIVNVALVAMPATFGAAPLIAASKLGRGNSVLRTFRLPEEMDRIHHFAAAHLNVGVPDLIRALSKAATDAAVEKILADPAQPQEMRDLAELLKVWTGSQEDLDRAKAICQAVLAKAEKPLAPPDPSAPGADDPPPEHLNARQAQAWRNLGKLAKDPVLGAVPLRNVAPPRKLSRAEQKYCKAHNLTPAQFLSRAAALSKRG